MNVRQIRLALDYRSALYQTKQSDAAKAFLIGHDPGLEQGRHPTMGRLDEGIKDSGPGNTDDPVRHERLAAIG